MAEEERISAGFVETVSGWYAEHKRDLPWRHGNNPYHVWVSEIMLQQTRVEAVKPYYERFLTNLPAVSDLAACPEDRLLKLWEGLGYYSRVRNMQKAARQIMSGYGGKMPEEPEQLRKLAGIGDYTAGAVASIAFGRPVPAVDGNVLRIMTRVLQDDRDIMKQLVRREYASRLQAAMESFFGCDGESKQTPAFVPGDFNQGMMDLGASVCLPNAEPRCDACPLAGLCLAHREHRETAYPVRAKKKARRVEDHTILLIRDGEDIMLHKRPSKGLLAGMYEFPNLDGFLEEDEVLDYVKRLGLYAVRIRKLDNAKHIFSHMEWHMIGYEVRVSTFSGGVSDQIENGKPEGMEEGFFLADFETARNRYALPSAYQVYAKYLRGEI